ncbi:hypothetical protein LIER_42434 [Lithospermum erythrorhizon]|uniref:Uncharacterized protein n=1 Tax=Lithospermum erythrorhizon TaxID=34254 RepID=A0AAV3RQ45_LITER
MNPSHHEYSHYTNIEESYSNEETRRVPEPPIPQQKEQPQTPMTYSDPIMAAMQQQLDTFKQFFTTAFPTIIAPFAPTTRMSFSDQLDTFQLPPGFKLPQLELYDGTGDPIKHL